MAVVDDLAAAVAAAADPVAAVVTAAVAAVAMATEAVVTAAATAAAAESDAATKLKKKTKEPGLPIEVRVHFFSFRDGIGLDYRPTQQTVAGSRQRN